MALSEASADNLCEVVVDDADEGRASESDHRLAVLVVKFPVDAGAEIGIEDRAHCGLGEATWAVRVSHDRGATHLEALPVYDLRALSRPQPSAKQI